jgi:hypothetical protein
MVTEKFLLVTMGRCFVNIYEISHIQMCSITPMEGDGVRKWYEVHMKNGSTFSITEEEFKKFVYQYKSVVEIRG